MICKHILAWLHSGRISSDTVTHSHSMAGKDGLERFKDLRCFSSFTRVASNYRHYRCKSSALQELNTLSFPSTLPSGGKVLKCQTMFVPFLKGSRGPKLGIARSAISCIPYFRELLGKTRTQNPNASAEWLVALPKVVLQKPW